MNRIKFKKSRMCDNIRNDGTCLYGLKCLFAHSISDITPQLCLFGDNCVFINYDQCKKRICKYKHPFETTTSFHERIISNGSSHKVIQYELDTIDHVESDSIIPVHVNLSLYPILKKYIPVTYEEL